MFYNNRILIAYKHKACYYKLLCLHRSQIHHPVLQSSKISRSALQLLVLKVSYNETKCSYERARETLFIDFEVYVLLFIPNHLKGRCVVCGSVKKQVIMFKNSDVIRQHILK